VAPGKDQRVLDRILGAVAVAEDQVGDAIQPGIRGSHQDRERLVIAGLGSLDELSLHVVTGSARRIRPRSTQYEAGHALNGSLGRQRRRR